MMNRVNALLMLVLLLLLPTRGNAQPAGNTIVTELTWAEGVVGAPGRELAWLTVVSLDGDSRGKPVVVTFTVLGAGQPYTRVLALPLDGSPLKVAVHELLETDGTCIKVFAVKVTAFFRAAGNLVQRNADPLLFWKDADYLPPSDKTVTVLVNQP